MNQAPRPASQWFALAVRSTVVVLLIAATWTLWALWPENPLRECRVASAVLADWRKRVGPPTALVFRRAESPVPQPFPDQRLNLLYDRARLVDLATGRDLLPDVFSYLAASFAGGRLVWVYRSDNRIDVHDATDGRLCFVIPPSDARRYRMIKWDEESPYLLAMDWADGADIEIWDCDRGQKVAQLAPLKGFQTTLAGKHVIRRSARELKLLDAATGRELLHFEAPEGVDARLMAVRADAGAIAYLIPAADAVYSWLEIRSVPELEVLRRFQPLTPIPANPHLKFSRSGRIHQLVGDKECRNWDIHLPEPQPVSGTFDGQVVFAPDERHVAVTDSHGGQHWELHSTVLPAQREPRRLPRFGDHVHFAPSGRWLSYRRPENWRQLNPLEGLMVRVFGNRLKLLPVQTRLVEVATGRDVRGVPADFPYTFGLHEATFWTVDTEFSSTNRILALRFKEWPTVMPVPAWLWLLTAGGVAVVLFSFRPRRPVPDASSKRR
jgi:hypothetical protein